MLLVLIPNGNHRQNYKSNEGVMAKKSEQIDVSYLSRTNLVRIINTSSFAQTLKAKKIKGTITSATTTSNWINQNGCPVNSDGKHLNLADVTAWLAYERKGGAVSKKEKSLDKLKRELMQSQIDANNANTEYRKVKAELENFKKQMQDGEIVEVAEIEKRDVEKARYIRDVIESLDSYGSRLTGKNLAETKKELKLVVIDILNILARADEDGE